MAARLGALVCCLIGLLQAQTLIRNVPPVYPELAKSMRIQGIVKLAVAIDDDGTVLAVKLISGHPLLVNAAMDAVRQWRYRPTGKRAVTQVTIPFTISRGDSSSPASIAKPQSRKENLRASSVSSVTPW